MKKLKVLWICHFSNDEVRRKIPLTNKLKYHDFAPWIPNLANCIKNDKSIELHILSPHRGLLKTSVNFASNGINYYFFKPDLPSFRFGWSKSFRLNKITNYFFNKIIVNSHVKKIKPDLINLHGAENPYYSSTALWQKKLPLLVTIQGIYSNPKRFEGGHIKFEKHRSNIERKIHSRFTFFGIFPTFFSDLIKKDNSEPIFLYQNYIPNLNITKPSTDNKKEFDFVFFARVNHVKGIEEIIDALKIVSTYKKDVTLKIIGRANSNYLSYLNEKIESLGLSENVEIIGRLPKLEDVYSLAVKARATVIASKFENLPNTILESILLDVPVITTDAGGIPILNSKEETVLMSKVGDVQSFADNMILSLKEPEVISDMAKKAKEFVIKEFSEDVIVNRWVKQYHALSRNYLYNEEIPKELLFQN